MNKEINKLDSKVWKYNVICENLYHVDLGNYTTYGIKILNSNEIIHDVSSNKENVVFMTELFNKYQLHPVHIFEVLEDMLNQT